MYDPDNISKGLQGRYWAGMVYPRSKALNDISVKPFWRLPSFMKPQAVHSGYIVALDEKGYVVADLQDPEGAYPEITTVVETQDHYYLGSLTTGALSRCPKALV